MEKNSTLKIDFTRDEEKSLELNSKKLHPSEFTLKNILNYSKALSVRKTKKFGFVEFVLN